MLFFFICSANFTNNESGPDFSPSIHPVKNDLLYQVPTSLSSKLYFMIVNYQNS